MFCRLTKPFISFLKEFAIANFISLGLCADIAFHAGLLDESRKPISIVSVHDRQDNPHAHIIIPFRTVSKEGFHRTKTQMRYMNRKSYLTIWRKLWEELQNREFEKRGLDVRVSHKSLAAQGIVREATKHIGARAMALELRGVETVQGKDYRETMTYNKEREVEREMERERHKERARKQERDRSVERSRSFERSR